MTKSAAEQYIEWNQLSRHQLIVAHMTLVGAAGEAARARAVLTDAILWFEQNKPQWGPGTLPTWYTDASDLLRNPKSE